MNKDFNVSLGWTMPDSTVKLVAGAVLAVAGLYLMGVHVSAVN